MGVLIQGSDIPHIGCAIAQHLGIKSIPMDSALVSTHKYKMKCRFKEAGIPIPWFSQINSFDDLLDIVNTRGFPLIIKPVDRSGARGVFYLSGDSGLEDLYHKSKNLSFTGEVMVEEYLPGLQISTETIMYQGEAYTPGFADRNYEKLATYAPYIIENGGLMPSTASPSQVSAVEALVKDAALALGVTDGVVKGDVVLTPDGPKIIEMATRLSGGDFCESLIPLSCNVNIIEAAINIAIDREPDLKMLQPNFTCHVANRYFFPPAGKLQKIEGKELIENQEWVKKFELWYTEGDILPEMCSHADRFGVFVAVADTLEQLNERVCWVYENLKITVSTDI
jgi:biotin carboxylase